MTRLECSEIFSNTIRRKTFRSDVSWNETPLRRSLTTVDLTLIGAGAMIGSGLYVVTGVVAKEHTGPAIVVSYILAATAAFLSAFCYAEFACRIPRTGSAYTFTYIVFGELPAFLIGWNLILEYIIASASVSRAFSGYLDTLCNNAISNFTVEYLMNGKTWDVPLLASYPDVFAAIVAIVICVFVILGINVSSWVNGIFFIINMIVVAIILIVGFQYADIENWKEYGGFAPYGIDGVVAGASIVFYSYVGFDAIAISNEETTNPRKSVPWATFNSLVIATSVYILTSVVLTLMVPYTHIDETSAFAAIFAERGVKWAEWVIGIGALCAMTTSNLTSQFPASRVVYAMANDGLLFSWLAIVNKRTRVPIIAALVSLVIVVLCTVFFSLSQLAEFMSIGVLTAYAFVAVGLIILRYQPDAYNFTDPKEPPGKEKTSTKRSDGVRNHLQETQQPPQSHHKDATVSSGSRNSPHTPINPELPGTLKLQFRSMPIVKHLMNYKPGRVVFVSLVISIILQFSAIALLEYGMKYIRATEWWAIILLCLFIIGALSSFLIIPMHYQVKTSPEHFNVKCVPLIPGLANIFNIILLLKLSGVAWLRFIGWVTIGLLIYIFYGYRHSVEGEERRRLNGDYIRLEPPCKPYGITTPVGVQPHSHDQ